MWRISNRRVWVLILLIVSAQLLLQYYLLFRLAGGRYNYHVDNLWRAVSAYKWAQSPFFTWDPAKLPLEYALYGSALKFWPKPLTVIPTVNILLGGGVVIFVFLLGRLLLGSSRGAVIAAILPAFLQLSIGKMAEVPMAFFIMGGCISTSSSRKGPAFRSTSSI